MTAYAGPMNKSEEAYARLTQKIETGELPPGAILSEADLIDVAETGRTPLREAVQRLIRDHWLLVGGGRGLQVPPISVDDQLERLEVRRSLEALAVGFEHVSLDLIYGTPGESDDDLLRSVDTAIDTGVDRLVR